jgi:lipopolysaccharide transport system permease protein
MKEMISELIQYRHLLYMLAWRDIKIKYKQSVMGFLWAVFMPVVIITAGVLVKKAFSIVSGKPMELSQVASVSVKAIPWAFFVGSIRFATNSLTGNSNLVTKIYFPREVFPLSAVLANLFDFVVASAVLVIILIILGLGVSIYLLWVPMLLILLIFLAAGTGMLLCCGNLFFRDVKYIVEVILTFGIFFTPVFYEAKMFGKWETILLLNPIGSILEAINDVVVLHQAPNLYWLGYSAIWAVGGLLIAWNIFHKAEYTFAENI